MIIKNTKEIIFCFLCLSLILLASCEVFVIKGRKIVEEDNASYSQKTAIGAVKIFTTELLNENYLAASELLIKADGSFLAPTEKYEIVAELSRMKRFLEGKDIKREQIDTVSGTINVTLEIDNGNKAKFVTIEVEQLHYITEFIRE